MLNEKYFLNDVFMHKLLIKKGIGKKLAFLKIIYNF